MKTLMNNIRIMSSKKVFLLSALLLFLFTAQAADALNVSGAVLDPFRAIMDGLSPFTGPWIAGIIIVFLVFALSLSSAYISATLLENAIKTSNESIAILQGETAFVVQAGWSFMAGIVNMLLLISFLVIAIAIIMGSDSLGLKKALPQLIIVAFLVNFTLLFVGMAVDITNITYNTVANHFSQEGGGSILWDAINPLFNVSMLFLFGLITSLGLGVAMAAIPFSAPAAHTIGAMAFIILSPSLIRYIIISIILLLLTFIFLTFYAVFIMRGLIVNILAILSPLAFFCLIFPSTRQYFKMWLHHLLQWLMVGVVFIFFMYIAFALAPLAMELGAEAERNLTSNFFLRWWTSSLVPYIIILIYFVTILGVTRKMVPVLATMAMDQARNAVGVVAPYMQVAGNSVAKDFRRKYASEQAERMSNDPGYAARIRNDLTAQPTGTGVFARADAMWRRSSARLRYPTEAARDTLNDNLDRYDGLDDAGHQNAIQDNIRNKDYPAALAAIKSAQAKDIDVDGILRRLSVDEFKNLKIHADIVGETKNLEKMMFAQSLQAKNEGLSASAKQSNREQAILKLSPDDIKKLAPTLIEQSKDASDPARQAEANELLKEIAYSSKAQIKAFAEGGGKNAVQSLITNITLSPGATTTDIDRRKKVLSALSKEGGSRFLSDAERSEGRQAAKNGF